MKLQNDREVVSLVRICPANEDAQARREISRSAAELTLG